MRLKVTFTLWRETFTFTTCQNLGRWRQSIQKDYRVGGSVGIELKSRLLLRFALLCHPSVTDPFIPTCLRRILHKREHFVASLSVLQQHSVSQPQQIAKAQIRGAAVTRCVHCAHQNVKNNSTQGT